MEELPQQSGAAATRAEPAAFQAVILSRSMSRLLNLRFHRSNPSAVDGREQLRHDPCVAAILKAAQSAPDALSRRGAAEARLPTFWRLSMNLAPELLLRDLVALFGDACQVEKLSECTTIPGAAQFFRPE